MKHSVIKFGLFRFPLTCSCWLEDKILSLYATLEQSVAENEKGKTSIFVTNAF
jgi:hypothetical protein